MAACIFRKCADLDFVPACFLLLRYFGMIWLLILIVVALWSITGSMHAGLYFVFCGVISVSLLTMIHAWEAYSEGYTVVVIKLGSVSAFLTNFT